MTMPTRCRQNCQIFKDHVTRAGPVEAPPGFFYARGAIDRISPYMFALSCPRLNPTTSPAGGCRGHLFENAWWISTGRAHATD